MMECERCERHFCVDCVGMGTEVYKYMCKEEVIWCCSDCTPEIRSLIGGNTKDDANKDNQLTGLRKDLDETVSIVKQVMDELHAFMACDGNSNAKGKDKETKDTEAEASTSKDHVGEPAQGWTQIKRQPVKPFKEIM